jgi:hypothetical protein
MPQAIGIRLRHVVHRAACRFPRHERHVAFRIRTADSGNKVTCAFCPQCGSRLWHERTGAADTVTIKAGSLDEAVDFATAIHIWTSRKLPGVVIPTGAEQYAEEPPD